MYVPGGRAFWAEGISNAMSISRQHVGETARRQGAWGIVGEEKLRGEFREVEGGAL